MQRLSFRWSHLLIVLLALASVGCQARQIREAQDAFNDAARIENEQRADVLGGGSPLLDASSAAAGYRVSLDLLDAELRNHEQKLQQENLLGTALMLKAYCLWRLADLSGADDGAATIAQLNETLARIRADQTAKKIELGTRDLVMLKAIDGLRDHERGLRAKNLEDATANFRSALAVFDEALSNPALPTNHPIRVYLQLSQLASLRAWQAAVFQFEPSRDARQPFVQEIHSRAKQVVASLEPAMELDEDLGKLVKRYSDAIGI